MAFNRKKFYGFIDSQDINAVLACFEDNTVLGTINISGYFGKKIVSALQNDYAEKLVDLLKKHQLVDLAVTESSQKTFDLGRTLLMSAAHFGADKLVKALLDAGADVNITSKYGHDAFLAAIGGSNMSIAKMLIEAGANPYQGKIAGRTALLEACHVGSMEIAEWLLTDFEFDLKKKDKGRLSVLHHAAMNGMLPLVKILLEKGVVVDELGPKSIAPLSSAARRGYVDVAGYLLEHGADPNHQDTDGNTAIFDSVYQGLFLDVLKVCVEHGADINYRLPYKGTYAGHTLLMRLASLPNHLDAVHYLMERGVDTEMVLGGYTAMDMARQHGNLDFVDLIRSFKDQKALEGGINAADSSNSLSF